MEAVITHDIRITHLMKMLEEDDYRSLDDVYRGILQTFLNTEM